MIQWVCADEGEEIQDELAGITGSHTVPQVFIKGEFIGGCDGRPCNPAAMQGLALWWLSLHLSYVTDNSNVVFVRLQMLRSSCIRQIIRYSGKFARFAVDCIVWLCCRDDGAESQWEAEGEIGKGRHQRCFLR